jgi:exodeoxyribonuclease VII small subunit
LSDDAKRDDEPGVQVSEIESTEEEDRPVGDLSYAQAASELDAIIRELDQGLIDVDRLEVRFRRAVELVEELDRRVRGVRERVDALIPRLDAIAPEHDG